MKNKARFDAELTETPIPIFTILESGDLVKMPLGYKAIFVTYFLNNVSYVTFHGLN